MNKLIEVEDRMSFYHVPGYETLAISMAGVVIDLVRDVVLERVIRPDGYPRVKTVGYGELHIHRLLAVTFIPCHGEHQELYVNHKDGVKTNLDLSNLEWTTPSENSIHAYMTGLRTDNRPVVTMDLITGNTERFYSLQECARSFECKASLLHQYLNGKRRNPFQKKYVVKYEDGSWPDLSEVVINPGGPGFARSVIAREVSTGKAIVFDSASSAARYLKLPDASVRKRLCSTESREISGWLLYYRDNYDGELHNAEWIRTPKREKSDEWCRKPLEVMVTDTTDNSQSQWPSLEAFAISVGMKKNTIQKSLLVKEGMWRDFKIEYLRKTNSPPGQ